MTKCDGPVRLKMIEYCCMTSEQRCQWLSEITSGRFCTYMEPKGEIMALRQNNGRLHAPGWCPLRHEG